MLVCGRRSAGHGRPAEFGQPVAIGRYWTRSIRSSWGLSSAQTFDVNGLRFGINICFDTNFADAAMSVAEQGASLLVCPANNMLPRQVASEWRDKHNTVRGERCRETGLWLMSADVTGSREDRVAWGPTAVLNPAGEIVAQLPLDAPGLLIFDMPATASAQPAKGPLRA